MARLAVLLLTVFSLWSNGTVAQSVPVTDTATVVRGISLNIPNRTNLPIFLDFIRNDLRVARVNTLVLRIGTNYQYASRPELVNKNAYGRSEIKQIVAACREHNIRLIPLVNLFGHQSWHSKLGQLLTVYPQFDETPTVPLPPEGTYEWPNEDGLYCKSYCPRHPDVHDVVFDLVDEIVKVCEADAFHAGLDEVFYLAMDECPRCSGADPATIFAEETTRIRNHLAEQNIDMWMWGDRLIDGKTTGIGAWEASMNNTHRAVDRIPTDIVICDWHYERADPTAAYFATKGFDVVTCPWRTADVAVEQVKLLGQLRKNTTPTMQPRFAGMMQTIWSSTTEFIAVYRGEKPNRDPNGNQAACFKALVEVW